MHQHVQIVALLLRSCMHVTASLVTLMHLQRVPVHGRFPIQLVNEQECSMNVTSRQVLPALGQQTNEHQA